MANRYWVGGNGTWDGTTTTNWSTASGGAGGASVPGTADAVLFDYNSGTGTATIATGYTPNIVSINYQPNNFTLNLNNNTLITQTYSQSNIAATNVNRVIAFGNGQINITGFNQQVAGFRYETGLSYTGNARFNLTYTGSVGTRTITCVGYGSSIPTNIYVTGGSDILTMSGGSGIVTGDLVLTGSSVRFTPNQHFLYGNLILSPTMTLNGAAAGGLFISAGSGNRFITTNGAPFPQTSFKFPYTGTTGASYALTDANVTLPLTTFTSGTLDLATYNPNVTFSGTFSATGTNARTIKWGNGNVVFTGTNTTLIDMTNVTGLAQTGNANIQLTGNGTSGQTRTIVVGTTGATYARTTSFNVTGGNDIVSVNGYYNNFTFQPAFTGSLSSTGSNPRAFYGNLTLHNAMTIANSAYAITMAPQSGNTYLTTGNIPFNCPLTIIGATGANAVLNNDIIMPESANGVFTFSSGGFNANAKTVNAWSFVTTGSSVRYFNQNGGTINLTGSNVTVVDFASTNWSTNVNPTFNLTYSGSTGNRVVASYFTSEATSISYNVSGADSVAVYGANNVNFAGFSGNFYTVGNTTVYGNLLLSSSMNTIATNSAVTIAGSARTLTVDTANQTVRFPLTINASGSNVTLANGFVTNPKPLVISAGNTTVVGNVTVSAVSVTGTAVRTLNMGNGSWTVTGTGSVWLDSSSNVTYVPGNTTVEFTTDTAARSLTFSNTANLNNVIISGNTANSMANISGNLTLNTLSANIPVAWNLNLGGGKTYTMQNWTVTGSANNMVTLGSTIAGTKHNLVLTGGGNINTVDYLRIQDSNAAPALTWYPGANSINLGNVTGWVFPALNSSNFFLVF